LIEEFIDSLKFDENGLLPGVVQDIDNGQVLMVAYMNKESVKLTLETGRASFWSRSRQKFWIKGETSGNTQDVQEMYIDCDKDCIVMKVKAKGAACHEGYRSCFFRKVSSDGSEKVVLEKLQEAY
jgi:phosphoribosyl-AMP cyclohydrolase